MKKMLSLFFAFVLMLSAAGCAAPTETVSEVASQTVSTESAASSGFMPVSESENPPCENPDAELDYEEYFAQDRLFKIESELFPQQVTKQVDENGSLYVTVAPATEPTLVWEGKNGFIRDFSDVRVIYDHLLFVTGGTRIMSCDLYGNDMKLLLEFDGEITKIIGNSELVFFQSGTSIYRLHRKSMTLEKVFTHEELQGFSPMYNNVIAYRLPNPEWKEEYLDSNPEYSSEITFYYNIRTGEDRPYSDEIYEQWLADKTAWDESVAIKITEKND